MDDGQGSRRQRRGRRKSEQQYAHEAGTSSAWGRHVPNLTGQTGERNRDRTGYSWAGTAVFRRLLAVFLRVGAGSSVWPSVTMSVMNLRWP